MSEIASQEHLRKLFQEIIDSNQSWLQLIKNKRIAQLGDSLANFIYSLAYSLTKGRCSGKRVPDAVLANAYHASALKTDLPVRGKKGQVGDAVEAFLLLSWLSGTIELEEMIMTLASHLQIPKRPTRREEISGATIAFQRLLDEITARFHKDNFDEGGFSPSSPFQGIP
ncbi:MAG: ribonuclease III family protein [Candidatus Thorarchaeota archaeon]